MAEKIAGTTTAAMGFVKDDLYYYPNSALQTDVKTICEKPFLKVSATFIKEIDDERYSKLTYIAKEKTIGDIIIIPGIREKVSFTP